MEESQISTLLTTKICRSVDVPAVAVMIVLHDLREHPVGYALTAAEVALNFIQPKWLAMSCHV